MHQHRQDVALVRIPRIGAEVPEVGIEGQIAGGPHKTHQFALRGLHPQVPEAVVQHPLPPVWVAAAIAAGQQQPIELVGAGEAVGEQRIALPQTRGLGLAAERDQEGIQCWAELGWLRGGSGGVVSPCCACPRRCH